MHGFEGLLRRFGWAILLLTGYSCMPPQSRDDNSESCGAKFSCQLATNCVSEVDLLGTVFPCSDYGEPLKICCPIQNNASKPQPAAATTKKPASPTTVKSTTAKPASTTLKPAEQSVWTKIPKNLQSKVKLLPNDCGKTGLLNRIVFGQNSEVGQFPWMALLGYQMGDEIKFWCGGTLISKRYVLTAAHCANVATFAPKIARLGEWNVSSEVDCSADNDCAPPIIDVPVEQVIIHERFGDKDLPSFQNDIALLRLGQDVEFNDYVWPICLHPEIPRNANITYVISGWGLSEAGATILNPVLQFARVRHYDFGECNSIAPAEVKPLARSQFCAGGSIENTCKGDSGGPVSFTLKGTDKVYQRGIVSLATSPECGVEEKPNIYTEVAHYVLWILKTIR